jgi:hypothetical protein
MDAFLNPENLYVDRYIDGALYKGAEVMLSNEIDTNILTNVLKHIKLKNSMYDNYDNNDKNINQDIDNSIRSNINDKNNQTKMMNENLSTMKTLLHIKQNLLYIAVPIALEGKLLSALQITPYNPSTRTIIQVTKPMDLSGGNIRRRIDP